MNVSALPWSRSMRLVLREFQPEDVDAVAAMHRNPRLRAMLIDDFPLQLRPIARLFIERITTRYREHEGLGIWHAEVRLPERQFAGWFSLMPRDDGSGDVEIGSRLLPSAWRGSLAQEGFEMMLDHAADDLKLSVAWGVCHPDNRSALAVLAAMGFQPMGLMPYAGSLASHLRLELNAWRDLRNTPRKTRVRRALRAIAEHRVATTSSMQRSPPDGAEDEAEASSLRRAGPAG